MSLTAVAYEDLTVAGTAVELTDATFSTANHAFITVEVASVRFRLDGTAPTATVGHEAQVGDVIRLETRDELNRFQAIRTGGTSATLRCTYLIGEEY